MFTWICPKCGREVPPAYTECPDCIAKTAEPPAAEAPVETGPQAAAPPPPREPVPMYQAMPPQQPVRYAPPVPGGGLPTWLMTVLFAGLFAALGAGIYWLVGSRTPSAVSGAGNMTPVENPAAKAGAMTHPYQKYIEISGVRFIENAKKKPEVKFVVVNHSAAELDGLSGNVTLWARTQKSEEDAAGTFSFNTSLRPWETKDLSAPLTTKHRIYELPDWQNLSTDIQITAPAISGGSAAPR